jgi:thiamine-monophosphate kinase
VRELELITALEQALADGGPRVISSLGDDAAVVRARGYAVTSVDTMVEGIHFRAGDLSAEKIGHRALAAALSDLAAMGAAPGEAYLALGLPADTELAYALALLGGAKALAERTGVTIAGGDVTRCPTLVVSFTVVGWSDDPGEVVGRSGAQIGDLVGVTGTLGEAGAGLALLEDRAQLADPEQASALMERYARPEPRLAEGRGLAQAGVHAMIDVSDGLATDAGHIARRSGVRLELSLAALPVSGPVANVADQLGEDGRVLAATAGDDYELCVCAPPKTRNAINAIVRGSVGVTWIGKVLDGPPGVEFADFPGELAGFEHKL